MATKIVLMNEGVIQQAGKPEEFYNKPANIFVAQFIGSPTMNIIKGKIVNGVFISNNQLIKITPRPEEEDSINKFEGKEVSVGIRSERFEAGGKFGDTFEANIEVVEMLGKEKILYTRLDDGTQIIISTPGHYKYNEEERHSFGFDLDALHFFSNDTGERIN